MRLKGEMRTSVNVLNQKRLAPDLVQLPVELGGLVVLRFCRLLAEEEDEPAVVHVEGVVVPVHVCGGKQNVMGAEG